MRCSTTVARQLCASAVRGALPIASTSRPVLRASLAPAASCLRAQSRSVVTIPHPDLDPSKGTSHFVIRSFGSIPTIIHALAMMRAVEERLGPVVSVQVAKDEDTHKPLNTIFITLLRPTTLPEALVLEIPAPTLSRMSNHTGGPSFADLANVLRNGRTAPRGHEGGESQTLRFDVTERKSEPVVTRARAQHTEPNEAEMQEDDAIVRSLAAFDGGFNGGLAGIADKFKELELAAPPSPEEEPGLVEVEEQFEEEEIAPESPALASQPATAEANQPVKRKASKQKSAGPDRLDRLRKNIIASNAHNARVETEKAEQAAASAAAAAARAQSRTKTGPTAAAPKTTGAPTPGSQDDGKSGLFSKWFGGKA